MSLTAQVVDLGNDRYLSDYMELMMVPGSLFSDIVTLFLRDPERASKAAALQELLENCADMVLRHKLAVEAGLTKYAEALLRQSYVVAEVGLMNQPVPSRRKLSSRSVLR
jgi:hypothetical protein